MLGPRHGTPQPLLGARDKTENQLPGHVPPQRPLRISEIALLCGTAIIPRLLNSAEYFDPTPKSTHNFL
jgi:hypothetical protein